MTVRDQLLRAVVFAGADAATVVRAHRLAPLVELAVEIQAAGNVDRLLEAAVAARTIRIERDLYVARREATLAWARVAVLQAAVVDQAAAVDSDRAAAVCSTTDPEREETPA